MFYHKNFINERKKSGYMSKALCEKLGISKTTLWNWENGKTEPKKEQIHSLANILNIDISKISDISNFHAHSHLDINIIAKPLRTIVNKDNGVIQKSYKIQSLVEEVNNELLILTSAIYTFMNNMKSIIYMKNTNLNYVLVNKVFRKFYKISSKYNIYEKNDFDLFSASDALENNREETEVINTGKMIKNKLTYIPGTRKQKTGFISKYPVFDSNNKVLGLLVTMSNDKELNL
jgi:transcriptional regulator with XRE-family HTH domain